MYYRLQRQGCLCQVAPFPPDEFNEYNKQQILIFGDHGGRDQLAGTLVSRQSSNWFMPWFDLTYTFGNACSTNDFWGADYYNDGEVIFGATHLRRGAIGYIGAVGGSYVNNYNRKFIGFLTGPERLSMGEVSKLMFIYNYMYKYNILLGDPVLKPRAKEVDWT